MGITDICQTIRHHWHTLTETLWPPSDRERTEAEIERLDGVLERLHVRMVRLRSKIETTRGSRRARLEVRYEVYRIRLERKKSLRRDLVSGCVVVLPPREAIP